MSLRPRMDGADPRRLSRLAPGAPGRWAGSRVVCRGVWRRGLVGVAAGLALIFLLACSGTALARSVSVGHGRTMYLECRGHGGPTVVLISGFVTAPTSGTRPRSRAIRARRCCRPRRGLRACARMTGRAPARTQMMKTQPRWARRRAGPRRCAQPVSARDGARDLNALLKPRDCPAPTSSWAIPTAAPLRRSTAASIPATSPVSSSSMPYPRVSPRADPRAADDLRGTQRSARRRPRGHRGAQRSQRPLLSCAAPSRRGRRRSCSPPTKIS